MSNYIKLSNGDSNKMTARTEDMSWMDFLSHMLMLKEYF